MTEDTPRPAPPKEGSNRGHVVDKRSRANIENTISGRPPKSHSDHIDDGFPGDAQPEDGEPMHESDDGEQARRVPLTKRRQGSSVRSDRLSSSFDANAAMSPR